MSWSAARERRNCRVRNLRSGQSSLSCDACEFRRLPSMNTTESMTERVRRSVLDMPMAQTLKLAFRRIEPGDVELELPGQEAWCFRPGQLQATAIFAAADFAAVSAAGTLLSPGFIN